MEGNVQERRPFISKRASIDHRFKYYQKLVGPETADYFQIPTHLLPPDILIIPLIQPERGGKQRSITTIFSIWNTMIGSSLLALPWCFTQSGFATGLATVAVVGMMCLYTACLIVWDSKGSEDFMEVCLKYLGKPGQYLGWVSSVLVLLGAVIAFDILMSDGLHDLVQGIILHCGGGESPYWNKKIAPLFIFAIVFPLANIKHFQILVKINSGGVFCVIYIIIFIIVQSLSKEATNIDIKEIPQYESNFYYLAGVLVLSFFLHNFVLPILSNQAHPENNIRDLSIGYLLVGLSLAIVGGVGYLSYGEILRDVQDFLFLFHMRDYYPMTARLALVLQLATVTPVVLYIIRIQFFGFLMGKDYPGFLYVFMLNLVYCTITTLFAIFFPQVGTVLRFTGAGCGLIYVFVLPVCVHLVKGRKEQTLTIYSAIFHVSLLLIGTAIFISQFF